MDPGFFYETVAPLLLVGVTSLICISTLTSDINFYTRLFKCRDPVSNLPTFKQLQVTLACEKCKNEGKAAECKHMLHLVPRWQSSTRHERLRVVMADRPDLIQSELSGLAFDALQQCFRTEDIDAVMTMKPPDIEWKQRLFMIIDPAAGGPQSDFAIVTLTRNKGMVTVNIIIIMIIIIIMKLCSMIFLLDGPFKVLHAHILIDQEFQNQLVSQHHKKTTSLMWT